MNVSKYKLSYEDNDWIQSTTATTKITRRVLSLWRRLPNVTHVFNH